MESVENNKEPRTINYSYALIPVGIAINMVIGNIVTWLKLPVYLDEIGTILVTLFIGWKAGAITGVLSFILGGIFFNPVLPYFCGTQIAVAIYVYLISLRGGLKNIPLTIICGIGLGVIAGIISAPVIVYLFGGITGSGPSVVVAYLLSTGKSIIKSVVLSGLASEPLDKTLQLLIAVFIIKGLPNSLLLKLKNRILIKNGFLKEN